MSIRTSFIGISIIAIVVTVISVNGSKVSASDAACQPVEAVFARGSGQTLGGEDTEQFEEQLTSSIKAPLGMNYYELGTSTYSGHKYEAIEASTWNAIGAGISSGYANAYGKSVDSGVGELYNYLTERYEKCKDTGSKFILGGYSQGAQVVGQTLPKLTKGLRDNIVFTAFFGDPKLHLPEGEGWNPPACQGRELSPYRRIIANCHVDNGALGARKPYLPDDMRDKSGLWCYEKDYVCGASKAPWVLEGHGQYNVPGQAIDLAVKEAVSRLAKVLPPELAKHLEQSDGIGEGTTGLDVVFMIDTTGSMYSQIQQAKAFAQASAEKIKELRGRVALVAFRDLGDEYTAKIMTGFNEDHIEFQQQLNDLRVNGGGDGPEAVLHALKTAFDGLDWKHGATKAAVVLTDADFHNPDKVDGSTIESIAKRSLEIDPVNVYPVVSSGAQGVYQELAELTSGQVIQNTGDTQAALTEALTRIEHRPTALLKNMEYSAEPGQEITFDASDSYVVGAEITKYEWDFDGDGTFERETTEPVVHHTYHELFDGVMQVRMTASNGTIANASAVVKIGTYEPPLEVTPPKNMKVTVRETRDGISTVKLEWTPADELAASWVVAVNGVGLGTLEADRTSVEITDVERDKPVEFGIAGILEDGSVGDYATVLLETEDTPQEPPSKPEPQKNWLEQLLQLIKKIVHKLLYRLF